MKNNKDTTADKNDIKPFKKKNEITDKHEIANRIRQYLKRRRKK